MTTIASTPTHDLREELDGLLARLARINAARSTMRITADDPGCSSGTLDPMLDTLERELTLAARATAHLHDRVAAGPGA